MSIGGLGWGRVVGRGRGRVDESVVGWVLGKKVVGGVLGGF